MIPLARSTCVLLAGCLAAACTPGTEAPAVGPPVSVAEGGLALGAADTPPRLLGCADGGPSAGVAGMRSVYLEFTVSAEGTVERAGIQQVRMHRGSTSAEVRQRAEQALLTCRYEPAIRDGEPVPVRMRRTVAVSVAAADPPPERRRAQ